MTRAGMAPCVFCGNAVDGNYRRVYGWEKTRDRGGLHGLIDRKETGEQACDTCGYDLSHGVAPGTPKLFEIPPVGKTTFRGRARTEETKGIDWLVSDGDSHSIAKIDRYEAGEE